MGHTGLSGLGNPQPDQSREALFMSQNAAETNGTTAASLTGESHNLFVTSRT